jgi:subtilisin family serine protease
MLTRGARAISGSGRRRWGGGLLLGLLIVVFGLIAASPAATPTTTELSPSTSAASRDRDGVLVELVRATALQEAASLRRAGATLVEHGLQIWALPPRIARRLLPSLVRRGLARRVETDRSVRVLSSRAGQAVLPGSEWWLGAIHAAKLTPPGPGKPVTVVDTGVDVYHPEFAGRPNTMLLNPQTGTDLPGDFHGTAVSSLIGAPGVGTMGVYPEAVLREWDASPGGNLRLSRIIAGIDAAMMAGPGVINLSLGGPVDDPLLREAVLDAVHRGSLVVAAQGEDRFGGSPQTFPADEAHVLTVVATDRQDTVYVDTNGSESNDLSAPGVQVEVAVPTSASPSGYEMVTGTSYAAALVSGAAAWVWTKRPTLDPSQLFQLLVRSARPLAPAYNSVSGYGELDLRAALAAPTPPGDPFEPNDDVDMIRAGGLFKAGTPSLTNRVRKTAFIRGSLAQNADPRDVFRVWIPPHGSLAATATSHRAAITLRAWRASTRTVLEGLARERRDLLAIDQGKGIARLRVSSSSRRGMYAYLEISLGSAQNSSYALALSTHSAP